MDLERMEVTAEDVLPVKPPVLSKNDRKRERPLYMLENKLAIPQRRSPGSGGSSGRLTVVKVNHIPINLEEFYKKTVYQINVIFNPTNPKRLRRLALKNFNFKHYPDVHFAFDGQSNMYTTVELKEKTDSISILDDEHNKTVVFIIDTKVVNTFHMNTVEQYLKTGSSNNIPHGALQVLDVVLKNRQSSLRLIENGKLLFPIPRSMPEDLGDGLELWKGFHQSLVMGWKPYINVDVIYKRFPKHQPLIDYIAVNLHCDLNVEMNQNSIFLLANYIQGLKVHFEIPNQPNSKRTYKVNGLLSSASTFYFEKIDLNNVVKMNVVQYFKLARNYVIKYPNLPCLHVGSVNKKSAVPIELCIVQKGQLLWSKSFTGSQTEIMVKNSSHSPAERQRIIENAVKHVNYNEDPVLKHFSIKVEENLISVPARVLDQPFLEFAQNKEIIPKSGVWKAERFSKAVQIKRWIILNMDQCISYSNIKDFEQHLIQSGKDLNVGVSPVSSIFNCFLQKNWTVNEGLKAVANFFKKEKKNTNIFLVIVPSTTSSIYGIVKQAAEQIVGVLTQCIKSTTLSRMNLLAMNNFILKMNSKLNGVNYLIAERSRPPCMKDAIVFGVDISHSVSINNSVPSIAAVTANYDLNFSQYTMEWRLQPPSEDIILDLENIIYKHLNNFKNKTNVIPKKILYFRDGVGDTPIEHILEYELVAIRRACLRLNIFYTPPITILVIQKRHHTRMFPIHHIDRSGKAGNVCPGTVIDTHITHPTELDFLLCSHSTVAGTSRPTKYHVVWDDNCLKEDDIEQLTFFLCFMSARCSRSVSYPAPTYYAHLAANRVRSYLENKKIDINRLDEEQVKNKLNSKFVENSPMFYI